MLVKDLIARLNQMPGNASVFLASDEESNSFHPVADLEYSFFDHDDCEAIHPDDADASMDKAAVLWP